MENKKIKVKNTAINSGVSNKTGKKWTRVDVFVDEGGKEVKYFFFTTKSDGQPTKAFEFFKENKSSWDNALMMGEDLFVEIAYEETKRSFIGKDGKEHEATDRAIKMFKSEPLIGQPVGDQNQAEYRIITEDIPDL